jgi:hypothetical protein
VSIASINFKQGSRLAYGGKRIQDSKKHRLLLETSDGNVTNINFSCDWKLLVQGSWTPFPVKGILIDDQIRRGCESKM